MHVHEDIVLVQSNIGVALGSRCETVFYGTEISVKYLKWSG